jgi:hypothetical protein
MLSDIFEETAGRLVPGPELANLTSHLEVSVAERRVGLDWLQTRSGQNYASLEDGFSYAIPEAWFASPQGRVRSSSPVFGPALRIDLTNGFWQTLGRDTASVQEVWRNAAEARITARTQLRLAGDDPAHPHHEWGPAETAMNQASTAAMVDSVNRLERRYPQAFPQSSAAFEELYVAAMNARAQNSEKHLQKEAAIRFMDRVRLNFGDDIASGYTMPLAREGGELRVGLHVRQYLSLAWFAVNDAQIFNEEEVMRRKAGLIESLARIQRAHNDHGPGDAILWDPAAESDAPSCFLGTLKFIFESLNHHHPDVLGINPAESAVIAETTAGEVSAPGGGAMPAMADVSRDVRLENLRLFPIFWATLSEEDQVELEAQIEEYGEEIEELDTFKAYLQQLREAVRESLPRVTEEVLIQQTSPHVMLALLAEALDHCENSSDLGALAR